jgi:8-oxo-dGTP diphosphatase
VARGRSILVARRVQETHLGGAWEFPGGKVEPGEEPIAAALRELREETRLDASTAESLLVFVHDYPDRRLRFHAFLVRDATGEVATDGDRAWDWVDVSSLDELPMPDANRAIVRALHWRLG